MKKILICFLFLFAVRVDAQEKDVCFNNKDPFFDIFAAIKEPAKEKMRTMFEACSELGTKEMGKKSSLAESVMNTVGKGYAGILMGQGLSAFSTLDENQKQKEFQKEIDRIKQIEDPMTRIKQIYDLVVRHQGKYDYETMGMRAWRDGKFVGTYTPNNLIDSSAAEGTIGVCREMAALLQWSLLQVARHPSSKGGALSSKDFSSEFILGHVPEGGHAWVRVHLPRHDKEGRLLSFEDFDLDTTWFADFSPLYPRRSGITYKKQVELEGQCHMIIRCLKYREARTAPATNASPSSLKRSTKAVQ